MSEYEHGDTVTIELQATVIEHFKDGKIDVNLNGHGEGTLGGVNLFVESEDVVDDE